MQIYYKQQAERNSMELTIKNQSLIEKINELEIMKGNYKDSINKIHEMESKVNFLILDIKILKS